MIARVLVDRSGRAVGLHVGGFNLLPHRQRDARRLRRRVLRECAAAGLAGVAAALIWSATGSFAQERAERSRHRLEADLAELAAPVAEYRRLERVQASMRARSERSRMLARPREALWGVADVLRREPVAGIVLERLHLSSRGIEIVASAVDTAMPALLLERLGRVPGIRAAELADLRLGSGSGAGHGAVAFLARLAVNGADVQAQASEPHAFERGRR